MESESEKVSFNISPEDLGYINLLVSRGDYSTKNNFIHNAIKNELANNNAPVDHGNN
ncbi:hypothetical protein [Companilactobacillus hulinensis]|uniref:hypothetical protein n=1 Tax=Companilactobacillus hulinensis TaxID=2486007 RepID=UPI0013DDD2F7|nr:hypothetical protein [Companilactobacillus hulinensis]